jgi:flagellar biosynthesis/type III secretory pathway protein FliH
MMKKFRLSKFESIAQGLVEGSLSRLLGGDLEPLEVASRLARAMEDGQKDGRAPDGYKIFLNPADYEKIRQKNAQLEPELIKTVVELAQQSELRLKEQPQIELVADPNLKPRQVRVRAAFSDALGNTTQLHMKADEVKAAEQDLLADIAHLGGCMWP